MVFVPHSSHFEEHAELDGHSSRLAKSRAGGFRVNRSFSAARLGGLRTLPRRVTVLRASLDYTKCLIGENKGMSWNQLTFSCWHPLFFWSTCLYSPISLYTSWHFSCTPTLTSLVRFSPIKEPLLMMLMTTTTTTMMILLCDLDHDCCCCCYCIDCILGLSEPRLHLLAISCQCLLSHWWKIEGSGEVFAWKLKWVWENFSGDWQN